MIRSSPICSAAGTPLLRISRPVAACSRCRRSKIKCDGKLPACSACERAGHANSCASPIDKSVVGNEKSYVACLESRIRELEARVGFFTSRKSSGPIEDFCQTVERSKNESSISTICTDGDKKAARRREAADVNELVSNFGFLSINATTQDFERAKTNMTFARLILAAASNEPLPNYEPVRLPSKPEAKSLATYYIENILSMTPIFSENILLSALDAIYQENLHPVSDSGYWLFCMVLAISSSSQSRNKTDKFYSDGVIWVKRALSFADSVLVPGCVSQIQALVLLVQYSMIDPAHFDSWILVGFACRALVDLGYHQDPPNEEQTDHNTLELRRSLFYCVYSLDRSISMVHARSFSFTDDSTSVTFPSPKTEISSTNVKSNFSAMNKIEQALPLFKLRKIQSSWYQELFQSNQNNLASSSTYVWQKCQEMQKWAKSIPEDLSDSIKELLDLELFYSYIYCLAPSNKVKDVSACGNNLIFESCIKYVQKMAKICQVSNCIFYTYHDALRVFFVGCQFVSILAEDQDQLLNSFTPLIEPKDKIMLSYQPPFATTISNIEKTLCCIDQIIEILESFSYRWEDSKVLLLSFQSQTCHLAGILKERKNAARIISQF